MDSHTTPAAFNGLSKDSKRPHLSRDIAFQLSLGWLLAVLVWFLVEPEPLAASIHLTQWIALGLGLCVSAGLWIANSHRTLLLKMLVIACCAGAVAIIGWKSSVDFDGDTVIVKPARLENGRIIHQALDLSYALPAKCRVNLVPQITRGNSTDIREDLRSPFRLRSGDVGIMIRIEKIPELHETNRKSGFIFFALHPHYLVDNGKLIRFVRSVESQVAASGRNRILQSAQETQVAGLDAVEFKFINEQQHVISRQVFMRTGNYILNFMLISGDDSEPAMFEECLQSIRLNSSRPNF